MAKQNEEKTFLSIGKVSKLKNVSIKSLRYYDSIGILKPAFVNAETNYRYYKEEQLYLLDAITLCLRLGVPLRSLSDYVDGDSINLQKLLYDGKELAERQMRDIREACEQLQETINHAGAISGMVKIPDSTRGKKSDVGLEDTVTRAAKAAERREEEAAAQENTVSAAAAEVPSLPRNLLAVQLEEDTNPRYYGQFILQLFVKAQQLGLEVSYPSGIYYEYSNVRIGGTFNRFMYLTITTALSDDPTQPLSVNKLKEKLLETRGSDEHGFVIRTVPAVPFYTKELTAHIERAQLPEKEPSELLPAETLAQNPAAKDLLWFLETDIMDAKKKETGVLYLLEYPLQFPES